LPRVWRIPADSPIVDLGMRFSLQVHYAICGIFDLAYNGQGAPVQVRVIGERQQIPTRYLEQIFQRLRRAKLVRGKRGPGGGYTLARPSGRITLRDIVEAVEGPIGAAPWLEPGDVRAGAKAPRRVLHRPDFLWGLLAESFSELLAELSIEDVCRLAAKAAVRRANLEAHVYEI
jgi:Rrf2 family protein